RVITYGGSDDLIRFRLVENYDCASGELFGRRNPFGDVLVLGVDGARHVDVSGTSGARDVHVSVNIKLLTRSGCADADVAVAAHKDIAGSAFRDLESVGAGTSVAAGINIHSKSCPVRHLHPTAIGCI